MKPQDVKDILSFANAVELNLRKVVWFDGETDRLYIRLEREDDTNMLLRFDLYRAEYWQPEGWSNECVG